MASATTFRVETAVPYGNASDIAVVERAKWSEISFAAHPHGGPEALWFCFRVARENGGGNRKIRLVLKHSSNMLGGGQPHNMRPVVRRAGEEWQRLGAPAIEELPDGRNLVCWELDGPDSFLDVAYCYPYGFPELDNLLKETGSFWRRDTIGVSQAGRPLVRLSNDYGQSGGQRPGLYLLARQHSGETSASWVLDGFLRQIAAEGEKAPLVWGVPLANIDGVEGGDYGKDNFPYDLNRAWGSPPMRHEVLVMQRDMRRWKERCAPALALDFHAPGACEANGLYGFVPPPEEEPAHGPTTRDWAALLAQALTPQYAAAPFERVAAYASRWETPNFTTYARREYSIPGLSLEVPYALAGERTLTREAYREAGQRIAAAIVARLAA